MSSQQPSVEAPPTIFRYDYPEAAADEWAVFWEATNEDAFAVTNGDIEDPSELASAWYAISKDTVVDLDDHV